MTLDVEQEWRNLQAALAPLDRQGALRLDRLEEPTLSAIQQALRRTDYHIFHFVGHGGFDEQNQDGLLILEDGNGNGSPVSGQYLGMMLHDAKTLRLALLNACEGGRTSRVDLFAGVCQTLLQQGVPAVIAMQFSITDQAAITLSQEFYRGLTDGLLTKLAACQLSCAFAGAKPAALNGSQFIDESALYPTKATLESRGTITLSDEPGVGVAPDESAINRFLVK